MKMLAFLFCLSFVGMAWGQQEKTIYQYKKYEKFDLGNLEVQGELIAPGDISVRERDRKRFELDLFVRREFDSFIKKDIETIR